MKSHWITLNPRLGDVRPGIKMTLDDVRWFDEEMGIIVTVPAGFCTDGASIPWPVHLFWKRLDPLTLQASIMHDYGYSCRKKLSIQYGHLDKWKKQSIDRRFYLGLRAGGCEIGRAKVYHFAVSRFGIFAWIRPNIKEVSE